MNARTQQTQSHNQEQQKGGEQNKPPRYQEYQVKLSSGEIFYLLALNSMNAAYSALELSIDRNCKLLDVSLTDEW
jgi:hypothetical protein